MSRLRGAQPVLEVRTRGWVVLARWSATAPETRRALENSHGQLWALAFLALLLHLATLG